MPQYPSLDCASYQARRILIPLLESANYLGALEQAETILCWSLCRADDEFQRQIISLISFCRPLASQQQRELQIALERERQEREVELARLAAAAAQKELLRQQAVAEFGGLANKFGVPLEELIEEEDIYRSIGILRNLETGELLTESERAWLESRQAYLALARIFYNEYLKSKDHWKLASSGKYLRKAGMSDKAAALAPDQLLSDVTDLKCRSALLTNRGAAKRDLEDLDAAVDDATEATRVCPSSYHPHTLLGAIHYQAGRPELGDKHFGIAIGLGGPVFTDREISFAIERSTPEAREKVAEYLLAKDPLRYRRLMSNHQ